MRRPALVLASLLVAALPGCATTALWVVGWNEPGHLQATGATGGRAWCVDEGEDRRRGPIDPEVAWAGWPEVAPVDTASRRHPRGPVYVVELAHDGERTSTAWVPGAWDGEGPARGLRVGGGAPSSSARPVSLRTVRAGQDGRALDVLVEDDGVAFVVSATTERWVSTEEDDSTAHSTLCRVVLTPFALAWDAATLPLQLVLLPVILW